MTRHRGSSRLRSDFYKAARDLGDIQSATKGPGGFAKRRVRKVAYRTTNGALPSILRIIDL
jgi:hypothetical protein